MEATWPAFLAILLIGVIGRLLYKMKTKIQSHDPHIKGGKGFLVRIWLIWERLFQWIYHVKPIEEGNQLLSYRIKVYRGEVLRLDEGGTLESGDKIVELHFNNERLYHLASEMRTPVQLAVQLIHDVDRIMPKIAALLIHEPAFQKVKGLYGVSLINRGTQKFGFTVMELPKGFFYFSSRLYLRLLLYIIHPEGKKRLNTKKELLVPKTIAISAAEVIKRFGQVDNP